MKGKKIIFCLIIFTFFGLFVFRKLHLQNFYKGKEEMVKLSREKIQARSEYDTGFIYIAHAGGGYNGKTYLNNLEAINNSYRLKINFIEIDFNYTSDSVMVLAHDLIKSKKEAFISEKSEGTHLSLSDLMEWLINKEIILITDIKTDNIKTLRWIISNYPSLSGKIIPQAYTIAEIILIKKMGFKNIIFTNYLSQYPNSIIKDLAATGILFGITLPYDINFKLLDYFTDFKRMRTRLLTHTVNDINMAAELRETGCGGIYTDFLLMPR